MQLLIDGVPNNVPLEALYVCQPPNEAPLVPVSVVQVKGPDVSEEDTPRVPVMLVFPVILAPPIVITNPPDKLAPALDIIPLHERDFVLLNDIFVLTPSLKANSGEDAVTL